jgi:hypothetical protein
MLGALALGVSGCGPRRDLIAEPQIVGNTIYVKVKEAYIMGGRVWVKTWMKNQTKQSIIIDRDGMQLRLDDGEVLERSSGSTTQHTPYQVAAGIGRDVHVDFQADPKKLQTIKKAWLVLGGIMIGDSVEPKVVGELELTITEVPQPGASADAESSAEPASSSEPASSASPESSASPVSSSVPKGK